MNGAGSRLAQAIHAGRGLADPAATAPLSTVRKWLITFSVMLVTVMQILDTSVTNVALPHMQGPILGPALGGWIADNWSWRWIFYINLPIGLIGFIMASAFVFDSPHQRKPGRVDVLGLALMVVGFGCLQLTLDWGEREDWFDSRLITGLAVVAACAIVGFVFRELTCAEPILDLIVFNDRHFAIASVVISLSVFAFYASMLLLALYTQKLLAYDAWTSGLVLAPGGLGNMLSLLVAGRLVTRMDQRMLIATGCFINGVAHSLMSNMTIGVDYWNLAWPRFVQGLGMGFVFVPLQTLALATVRMERLGNATAAFKVVRKAGGGAGLAAAATPP